MDQKDRRKWEKVLSIWTYKDVKNCSKKRRDRSRLTSGTLKLTAISFKVKGRSGTWRSLGWESCCRKVSRSSRISRRGHHRRERDWRWRMALWKMSTEGESIYRLRWLGVFLTYLFAASVKFKVVQMDMVTIRTIIKGLCRRFDGK